MTYVSKLFPSEKRGRALGIFQAVEMIGSFIGQTMGGFIAVLYGVRFNFLLGTFIGVIVLVLVSMTKGIEEKSSRDKPKSSFIPTFDDLRIVLNGTVVAACFINLFSMIVNTGLLNTILPIYAIEELSFSLTNFSFLVSGSTVGSVIGNLFGGVLSDRIGRKKVLIGGFILGAFSVYNLGVFTSFMPLLLFMFLKGIFWGIVYGVTPAYIADSVSDDARGMAIGIYRTFLDLGGLAGPIILSTLVDSVGYPQGYGYAFNFSSILILLCMIFVLKLKETK
jgi:MFS family permease